MGNASFQNATTSDVEATSQLTENSSLLNDELKVGWYGSRWWGRRGGRRLVGHENASFQNATALDVEAISQLTENSSLVNDELKVGWYGSRWWGCHGGRRLMGENV